MHPAISAELVACTVSIYRQCLHGEMAQRDMTACMSVRKQQLKECEVLTSHKFNYFSSLVSEASNTLVHLFNGSLVLLMSQMKTRACGSLSLIEIQLACPFVKSSIWIPLCVVHTWLGYIGRHFYPVVSPSIIRWISFVLTMSMNILITTPMRSHIDKGMFHSILIVSFIRWLTFSVPQHLETSTTQTTCPIFCPILSLLCHQCK